MSYIVILMSFTAIFPSIGYEPTELPSTASSTIREFEQENEVRRRRRGWQFLPVLHIILRILSLGLGVKTD
jgi:hypothetical protein